MSDRVYDALHALCPSRHAPPESGCPRVTPQASSSCRERSTEHSRRVASTAVPAAMSLGPKGLRCCGDRRISLKRRYGDNQYRFMLMCLAALEAPLNLPLQARRSQAAKSSQAAPCSPTWPVWAPAWSDTDASVVRNSG